MPPITFTWGGRWGAPSCTRCRRPPLSHWPGVREDPAGMWAWPPSPPGPKQPGTRRREEEQSLGLLSAQLGFLLLWSGCRPLAPQPGVMSLCLGSGRNSQSVGSWAPPESPGLLCHNGGGTMRALCVLQTSRRPALQGRPPSPGGGGARAGLGWGEGPVPRGSGRRQGRAGGIS